MTKGEKAIMVSLIDEACAQMDAGETSAAKALLAALRRTVSEDTKETP